ncbi:MAG: GNAT family N-acetyltransferase [Deferrisomatales bacterium]|nr:GNAT family N-acetyltransferase [Deferrisomatales bacterium]
MTRVLPAADPMPGAGYPICAYFSVAASTILRKTLPPRMAKKLPQYPVPVFLVAQLAVNSDCQGAGLGKVTLIKALKYLVEVNRYMRAVAVIVDPVDEEAQRFYEKYGFEVLCQNRGRDRMFLPMDTVVRLFA